MSRRQSRGIDPDLFAPSAQSSGDDRYVKAPPSACSNFDYRGTTSSSSQSGYRNDYDNIYASGNNQMQQEHSSQSGLTIELEHLSGYTGKGKNTIHAHPTDTDSYITCMGSAVVIGKIYDSQSQVLLCAHEEEINVMSLSSTGTFLASAQVPPHSGRTDRGGAFIVVWDLASGRERYRLEGFFRPVLQMAFSPDDHFLAASSEDCRIILWDMRPTFERRVSLRIAAMQYRLEVSTFSMPNVGIARTYLCAAITQTRTDVLAGTAAGELVVFNTESLVYRNAVPVVRNGVHSVAACGDTGYVYVGAGDGVLKKLVGRDPTGTSWVKYTTSSHLGSVTSCAFGDSCEEVATISLDGSIRVWDLSTYHLKCMTTEAVAGLCIAITKSSTHSGVMVSGWADGWLRAYDAATAQPKWHIATAHRGEVTAVACSAQYIVSGASDGGVSIWSFATRELVLQFHEHKRAVTGVLVDVKLPHRVHSCGVDKALFIYDLKGARRIVAQQVREGAFHGITQRLDSETEIVTAGADGRLLFWDCDEPDPVQFIVDPSRLRVTCVQVSPSGRFLATCGEDCEVKLFDVGSSALLASARGHSNTVNALAWSPDERQLVSVGSDSCICVWNFYQE
ncbi:Cilia- and flagella-associated protein 52 [Phytophthora cactorum]|nr:Cilia- and flagella-associated protein 52 [Phytophthora cactorum]